MKYVRLERTLPLASLFEKFVSTQPSFVITTKPLSKKKGENLCKGLK